MYPVNKYNEDIDKKKLSESNKEPQCLSIIQYNLDGKFIKKYKSILDASEQMGINKSSIGKCCKGYYKKSGGYRWEYTKESQEKRKQKKETNTKLKDNIIKLLSEGKKVCEVSKILGCNRIIVSYHKNKCK